MKNKILSMCIAACFLTAGSYAKGIKMDTTTAVFKKFYVGSSMDGAIFSTASIHHDAYHPAVFGSGTPGATGTLRFTYVINLGVNFNYNFNTRIGVYTGIDLKNVGYIEKSGGVTTKRRTYNLGVPIGIKFGNMVPKKSYFFAGGGLDLPINYKEKTFTKRSSKAKFNEWFSGRTPTVMPYVFAGMAFNHGLTLKLQYYPGNFLNSSYSFNPNNTTTGIQPYEGTTVHLILFSVGFSVPVRKPHDMAKKSVEQLHAN